MMGQNRSSAVMQQRSEVHDSLDDFPTPPWGGRALCRFLRRELLQYLQLVDVREPAANRGHLVRPLAEEFREVIASDVHDYGAGFPVHDYLMPVQDERRVAWTITNPPFRLAEQFIQRALDCSNIGVAMPVRSAFLEGTGRYERLFRDCPPTHVLQFSERLVMQKGRMLDPDVHIPAWSRKERAYVLRKPSTATAYAWLIWFKPHFGKPCQFHWTGTCRKALTRPGDYPDNKVVPVRIGIDWGAG